MTNGGEDGWQWASIRKSVKNIISILIDCEDCSHATDLYKEKDSDA